MSEAKRTVLRYGKIYNVIDKPAPHIIAKTEKGKSKKIHGWVSYPHPGKLNKKTGKRSFIGRRECSQERWLIDAYAGCWQNGCRGCMFCYTQGIPGDYRRFWEEGVATVWSDFDMRVQEQIEKCFVGATLYCSPVTDPFMDLEGIYHTNKNIINYALSVDLPVEFITKMGGSILRWPGYKETVLRMAAHKYKHCFAQFTIYTARESVRRALSPGSSTITEQLRAIKFCTSSKLFTVLRFDPFWPYLTDSEEEFKLIIEMAKYAGADHIITSCGDVPKDRALPPERNDNNRRSDFMFPFFSRLSKKYGSGASVEDYDNLYTDYQGNDRNANIEYRREKFGLFKDLCEDAEITVSLCMEFYKDAAGIYHGLNAEFMTSSACEGMVIPIYVRNDLDNKFKPLDKCDGNCLSYAEGDGKCNGVCNYQPFKEADGNNYQVYKKYKPVQKDKKDITSYF